MDPATVEAINAGGNLGILAVGLAVLDVRGKLADLRRRLDVMEIRHQMKGGGHGQ